MTDRETLATVSRSHDDYLGHRGTEKEKGRGTLQTSALPLGYGAGEVITSHGRSRFSTLGSAARRPPAIHRPRAPASPRPRCSATALGARRAALSSTWNYCRRAKPFPAHPPTPG